MWETLLQNVSAAGEQWRTICWLNVSCWISFMTLVDTFEVVWTRMTHFNQYFRCNCALFWSSWTRSSVFCVHITGLVSLKSSQSWVYIFFRDRISKLNLDDISKTSCDVNTVLHWTLLNALIITFYSQRDYILLESTSSDVLNCESKGKSRVSFFFVPTKISFCVRKAKLIIQKNKSRRQLDWFNYCKRWNKTLNHFFSSFKAVRLPQSYSCCSADGYKSPLRLRHKRSQS